MCVCIYGPKSYEGSWQVRDTGKSCSLSPKVICQIGPGRADLVDEVGRLCAGEFPLA